MSQKEAYPSPKQDEVKIRGLRSNKPKKSPMIDVAVAEDEADDDSCSSTSTGNSFKLSVLQLLQI